MLGIVASRLVERLHRPVFVLGRNPDDGLAQGSGRSIPAFHLLDALESMSDLFVRFGGHAHAAGRHAGRRARGRIPPPLQCVRRRAAVARTIFCDALEIDAVLELREITEQAIEELFTLAPFGHGNPPPLFAALGVEVAAPPTIMKEKHLRVTVRQNGRTLVLKAWNLAHRAAELVPGARVDVAFNLEEDAYSAARGYPPWAAMLRDFRPA